jgi:hypothetical protein
MLRSWGAAPESRAEFDVAAFCAAMAAGASQCLRISRCPQAGHPHSRSIAAAAPPVGVKTGKAWGEPYFPDRLALEKAGAAPCRQKP